jgi:hypothetical protein
MGLVVVLILVVLELAVVVLVVGVLAFKEVALPWLLFARLSSLSF